MNAIRKLLIFGLCMGWPLAAIAGWSVIGAAVQCAPDLKTFALAGTVEASEDSLRAVPVEEGFTALTDGAHEVRCSLGDTLVSGEVAVYPPAGGMCMGQGYISIERLRVGAVSLFSGPQAFNWPCLSEPGLVRLTLRIQDTALLIEKCYEHASKDRPDETEVKCAKEEYRERFRASFDCTKASKQGERLVCASDALALLDHQLYSVYHEAMRFQRSAALLRNAQRKWLIRRDSCTDEQCLKKTYEARIAELRALVPKVDLNAPVY